MHRGLLISAVFVQGLVAVAAPTARAEEPSASQPAASDSDQQASSLAREAAGEYRIGNVDRALALYQKAAKISRSPKYLLNLAQCYRQLKNRDRALFFYKLYLSRWEQVFPGMTPDYEADVKEIVRELEATPAAVGTASMPASGPATTPASGPAAPDGVRDDRVSSRRTKTILGFTALGLSVALGVAAGGVYGAAKSSGDDAQTLYRSAKTPEDIARYRGDLESANQKIVASYVLVGCAAAALGVSLYALLTRPPLETTPRVALSPTPGGGAIAITGRF